jgi:SAM-dependent methyltransferase
MISLSEKSRQKMTAAHYDAHPLDFMSSADEKEIEKVQPRPFLFFVGKYVTPQSCIAEIGCGPGRALLYMRKFSRYLSAVDISYKTLLLARTRVTNANFIQASGLELPFASASFDIVVCDGVIHHTPNARNAFEELARILAPGGALYLGVYKKGGRYYYLYNLLGKPFRALSRNFFGRLLLHLFLIPPYFLVHLIKWRGRRTFRGAVNFFYDYFITPTASFHDYDEIVSWGQAAKLQLAEYDPDVGNVHVFVFLKPAISQ